MATKKPKMALSDGLNTRDVSEKPSKKAKLSHVDSGDGKDATAKSVGTVQDVNTAKASGGTVGLKGSVNLDVIAKAKAALQQQKLLAEKLKKHLPQSKPEMGNPAMAVAVNSSTPQPLQTSLPQSAQPLLSIPGGAAQNLGASFAFPGMLQGLPGLMPGLDAISNYDSVKRAQELASRLGFHQGTMPLFSMVSQPTPDELAAAAHAKTVKAPVLRLDAQGREIDENGNVVDRPKITSISTLKVNINKQKKEAFRILRPELEADPVDHPFYDERMGLDKKKLVRAKRSSFQFVEEGKWSKQAEMLRLKSQFGDAKAKEMKTKQAALAKAKAEADINPNLIEVTERIPSKEEKIKDLIPEIEWWDGGLLPAGSYHDVLDGEPRIRMEKITIYVEHPVPIEPPAEPLPPAPQPLKLTKKEQKKLRTQRRLAKEKDRQEMIRQGLLEPPKPKVKMSNLMKVLGAEATQDPTRLEQEIRTAAAEREQAHTDRNLARKLTPAERKEKKQKKLFDDPTTIETIVSVYRMNDLSHPQTRFKVDRNASQNRLTGCVVMSDSMTVVVVEGGIKAIKRYSKLMLQRINWALALKEEDDGIDGGPRTNKCALVWQGSVAKPNFDKFFMQQCRTEAAARKYLADAGVAHYWDLAANFPED